MKKRVLSVALAIVMLICMMPNIAFAEAETETGITVYVTFFNKGVFCQDKESKVMWQRPVTVSDINADGKYSLDEALIAAHSTYHPSGADAYATSGSMVTKLWGVETKNNGFYRNNALTNAVTEEEVNPDDKITAFIYYDETSWSDRYSFFTEETKTVDKGTEFSMTLDYVGFDENYNSANLPVSMAPIGVYNMTTGAYTVPSTLKGENLGTIYMPRAATGIDGVAKMTFTKIGKYYLTAQYDSTNYATYKDDGSSAPNYLVPPVSVITVVDEDIKAVVEKIDAIGTVTADSGEQIEAARDAYDALTEEQKALVSNSSVLVDAEAAYVEILSDEAKKNIGKVADYLSSQYTTYAYGDEWAVYALTRAGKKLTEGQILDYYNSVAEKAAEWSTDTKPVTDLERTALALTVLGKDITDVEGVNLAELIYNSEHMSTGANAYTFALLALDAAKIEIPDDALHTRDEMIEKLLKFQQSDTGGFVLTGDSTSADVDVTAMALQALAPYAYNDRDCGVAASIGILYLQNSMDQSYGFSSWGTKNSESVAQVIIALSVLDLDPIQYGFGSENGSVITNLMEFYNTETNAFKHVTDGADNLMATTQGLEALEAYRRFQAGEDPYWQVVGETPEPSPTSVESETPSPTPTESVTPSATPSPTPTESVTPSATPMESETPSAAPESETPSPTPAESVTPSATPAESVKPSPTTGVSVTPSPKPTEAPVTTKPKQPVDANNVKVTNGSADVKGATVDTTKSGTASLVTLKKSVVKNEKSITIPKTVTVGGVKYRITVVKTNAFKNAPKATKITLPNSVVKIQKGAFNGVKKLKTVTLRIGSKKLTIAKNAFNKTNKNVKTVNFKNLKKSSSVNLKAGSLKNLNKKAVIKVSKKMTRKELNKFIKALKKAGFKNASKKNVKKAL